MEITKTTRRIVTGHDAQGKAVAIVDEPLTSKQRSPGGNAVTMLWVTAETPVDMSAYSMPIRVESPSPSQPRATIVRRPALDMPVAAARPIAVGQNGGDMPQPDGLGGEFDLNLELDVPAFLRRSEG